MAEALFKRTVEDRLAGQDWRVESAGTWAEEGLPASKNSIVAMLDRGIDITAHRSKRVRAELLQSFDVILTMEANHKEALQVEFSNLSDRIHMLSELVGKAQDIVDPLGMPLAAYEETAQEIERLLDKGFKKILHFTQS